MQNSFPRNVDVFVQQASGKTIVESNGEYGEVCKYTAGTGLHETSKMDSDRGSASRWRLLSQRVGSFQSCSLSLGNRVMNCRWMRSSCLVSAVDTEFRTNETYWTYVVSNARYNISK